MRRLIGSISLLAACAPPLCWAHTETGVAGGLLSGLWHPLAGFDHLIAMVAVGLWGAQLQRPAIWLLPIAFPLLMAVGGLLGVVGMPLPGLEVGIALSGVALGGAVLCHWRPPLAVALLLVMVFAVFHGHAHGGELPAAANPLAYGVGFVTTTGLLHAAGIGIGALTAWRRGQMIVRALGGGIMALGAYFLALSLGLGS